MKRSGTVTWTSNAPGPYFTGMYDETIATVRDAASTVKLDVKD